MKKVSKNYTVPLSVALLLLIFSAVLGNVLGSIMYMQTDTLNKLNDLSVEVERLNTLIESEQKQADTVSLEPCSYTLSVAERELVERVVSAEARGESIEGMMAVAQTIRDRATLWGMTVSEVVTAKGQYAEPFTDSVSNDVKIAVASVFDNNESIFTDPVTHFHNDTVKPYWAATKIKRGNVGNTRFYY